MTVIKLFKSNAYVSHFQVQFLMKTLCKNRSVVTEGGNLALFNVFRDPERERERNQTFYEIGFKNELKEIELNYKTIFMKHKMGPRSEPWGTPIH